MLNKKQRFLIDLDTMVDTRLGIVKQHWPKRLTADRLEEYHARDHVRVWDIFSIDEEEYKKAYDARDVETLTYSFGTQLAHVLRAIITTSVLKAETNPHIAQIEVSLNTFHYKLDRNVTNQFISVLRDILMVDDIKVSKEIVTQAVEVDINNMSAAELRKDYEGMIIYDLVDWVSKTNKLTAEKPAPTFTVYYAALLTDDSEESRRQITEDNVNPFKIVRIELARHFMADGLDAELFNIVKV